MGGGATKQVGDGLSQLTSEELAEEVGDLGQNYVPYKKFIVDNGLTGQILINMVNEELDSTLSDIGITSKLHRTCIVTMLNNLKSKPPSKKAKKPEDKKVKEKKFALPKDFTVAETVDIPPRTLLQQLFLLQGTQMNIYNPDADLLKLEEIIASNGDCNGIDSYDCFISYRVSADQDVARSIHDHLQRKGVFSFWDSVCLKPGYNWKDGFLEGLKKSRKLLWLVSTNSLEKVRDFRLDHSNDNYLLELMNAFKIKDALKIQNYVIPIFIGRNVGMSYKGFSDFNLDWYPDSVGPAPVACPYQFVRYHEQWWCGADKWLCCNHTSTIAPGCKSRRLSDQEQENMRKGIIHYHIGRKGDVGFAGLYITNERWKCCGKNALHTPGCKGLTLSGDEYRKLMIEKDANILITSDRDIDLSFS